MNKTIYCKVVNIEREREREKHIRRYNSKKREGRTIEAREKKVIEAEDTVDRKG